MWIPLEYFYGCFARPLRKELSRWNPWTIRIGIHLIPNINKDFCFRGYYTMLSDKDLGIKKFILERIMQIDDEIVQYDPEYKKLEERPTNC